MLERNFSFVAQKLLCNTPFLLHRSWPCTEVQKLLCNEEKKIFSKIFFRKIPLWFFLFEGGIFKGSWAAWLSLCKLPFMKKTPFFGRGKTLCWTKVKRTFVLHSRGAWFSLIAKGISLPFFPSFSPSALFYRSFCSSNSIKGIRSAVSA